MPKSRFFIPRFWKQSLVFKMWFLPILSTNSWFQNLVVRGNESRREKIQEILKLWCLNSSICSKNLLIDFRIEDFNFLEEIGRNCQMRWFIFNQRLRLNFNMRISVFKSRSCDLRWSVQILPRCMWRRGVAWFRPFDLLRMIVMNPRVHRAHLISTVITPQVNGWD